MFNRRYDFMRSCTSEAGLPCPNTELFETAIGLKLTFIRKLWCRASALTAVIYVARCSARMVASSPVV